MQGENHIINRILAGHIEPPIRMLLAAIDTCPDDIWAKADGSPPIWQHVLHAVYYLQKWLRLPDAPFNPPSFVDFAAVDFTAPAEPALSRDILRRYLLDVDDECRCLLANAGNDLLLREVAFEGRSLSLMDRTLNQIRHVMYHVGCISIILRRYTGEPLPWIGYEPGQGRSEKTSV